MIECISDIKALIEASLESLKDDNLIKEYSLTSNRVEEHGLSYKVILKIIDNDGLDHEWVFHGAGYEHDTKVKTWNNLLHSLMTHGIAACFRKLGWCK